MMKPIESLAIAGLLLVPHAGAAQLDRPTSPLPVFEMADRQDWVLRATLADGTVITGRVRSIDDTSVRLEGGRFDVAGVVVIDRANRGGGGGPSGAAVGAVALVVAGVLLAFGGFPAGGGSGGAAGLVVVVAVIATIGAVFGGLIGAAADPAEREWRQVWPAGDAP